MSDRAVEDYIKRVGHLPENPACRAKGHDLPDAQSDYLEFAPGCFFVRCKRCETPYAVMQSGMIPWNAELEAAAKMFAALKPLPEALDPRYQRVSTDMRPETHPMPPEVARCEPWEAKPK